MYWDIMDVYSHKIRKSYGYKIEYVESMLLIDFLKDANIIKEEDSQNDIKTAQIIQLGQHGDENAWEDFMLARGITPPKYQELQYKPTVEETKKALQDAKQKYMN